MTIREVGRAAEKQELLVDAFNVAIDGWVELIAEGELLQAAALTDRIFDQWEHYGRELPEWVEWYAETGGGEFQGWAS